MMLIVVVNFSEIHGKRILSALKYLILTLS